jgi:hypothetical protein
VAGNLHSSPPHPPPAFLVHTKLHTWFAQKRISRII